MKLTPRLSLCLSAAVEPLPGSAPQQFQLRQPVGSGRRRRDEQPAYRHPQDHQRPGLVPAAGNLSGPAVSTPVCGPVRRTAPGSSCVTVSVLSSLLQVIDFFNGNLKRRRQKRKEAKAMMKLKRLSTIHTEANGAVIGNTHTTHTHTHTQTDSDSWNLLVCY